MTSHDTTAAVATAPSVLLTYATVHSVARLTPALVRVELASPAFADLGDGAAKLVAHDERHHRSHIEREQRQQREAREPELVPAGPEGQRRRDHDERGAAERDDRPDPVIEAAVGHADAR